MSFAVAKALHFIGFVSWFAGLFYIVRLFVYHAEAAARPPAEREILQAQFELMAGRLWKIITVPAMVLTFGAGIYMVTLYPAIGGWLHTKFALLALLLAYHHACGRIRKAQAGRCSRWTPRGLRVFNEGATLLLVAIVFVAVLKDALGAVWGVAGLLVLGCVLMVAIRLYERLRSDAKGEA